MDHKPNNKLFEFFKERLSNPPQEDWNTPSDSIFENAMKELNAQKLSEEESNSNSKKPLLLLLLFLITAVGAYTVFDVSQGSVISVDYDASSIDENSNNKSTIVEAHNATVTTDHTSSNNSGHDNNRFDYQQSNKEVLLRTQLDKTIENSNRTSETEIKLDIDYVQSNGVTDDLINEIFIANSALLENMNTINSPLINQTKLDENSNLVTHDLKKELTELEPIRLLPIVVGDLFFEDVRRFDIDGLPYDVVVSKASSFPNKLSLGIVFNNTFTNYKMGSTKSSKFDEVSINNQNSHGNGARVFFKVPVHKGLSFVTGLSYNKVHSTSRHSATTEIESSNFNVDNGVEYFVEDMIIRTPFGTYECSLQKPIDHQALSTKSNMTNQTIVDQELSFAGIDIGLAYDFKTKNRLNYFVSSGIGINALLKTTTTLTSDIFMDGEWMWNVAPVTFEDANLQNYFINIQADAGLTYKLNEKFGLSFSTGYIHTLNSKIEHLDELNSKTILDQINLGVGFNVSF